MVTKASVPPDPSDDNNGKPHNLDKDATTQDLRRVRLLRDIAIIANETPSVADAVSKAVGLICRFAEWPDGAGYVAAPDAHGLRLCARIIIQSAESKSTDQDSRNDSPAMRSVAEDVVRDRRPAGSREDNGPHRERFIGFPIRVGEEIRGALVFRIGASKASRSGLLTLMTIVGTQLGRVIERDRARQELHARERLLTEIQLIAGLGHWRFDLATGQLTWSDQLYRLYGIPETSDLTYELYMSAIHPDDRSYVADVIQNAMDERRRFSHVHRVVLPDDSIRVIQGNGQVEVNADGSLTMWGTGLDVTRVANIEDRLKESERRYRLLAEHSSDMIVVSNGEGIIQYVSPASETLVGFRPDEMIGRSGYEYLHPDEIEELGKSHATLLESTAMQTVTYRFRHKAGTYVWLETTVRAFGMEGSGPIEIISSSRDVSDRVRAEAALRSSETRLRLMADTAVEAIITIDEDGNVCGWNPSATRIFGRDFSEVAGAPLMMLMPEKYRELHSNGLQRVVDTGHSKLAGKTVELEGLRANGEVFPLELSISSWQDSDGTFFAGFIRDISDRRRARMQLVEKSKQLRRLAARFERVREDERTKLSREVHDVLGQKLTALRLDLSSIESRVPTTDGFIADKIESAKDGIAELIQLVRRIASDLRPGVLDDLGLDAALEFEAEKFAKRTGISCSFAADVLYDHQIDRDQATAMFRIYQELLTNVARHAQCESVKITLTDDEGYLLMTVVDDGVGIRPQDIDGSGSLGILGMRERLAPWSGTITFESPESGGTMVLVQLPIKPHAEVENAL